MKNIIAEEVKKYFNEREYHLKMCEHYRTVELFNRTLDEGDGTKRDEVLSLIDNNEWEEQNANLFHESLNKSKHPLMLTDYSPSELSQMKLFKLKGYNIGYALKQFKNKGYSEIVAVHNNEPDVKGIGNELMQSAIKNGGCYLDHFDGFLSDLYSQAGFVEYRREPYNSEYDNGGRFKARYGEQDIIYRVHKSCTI